MDTHGITTCHSALIQTGLCFIHNLPMIAVGLPKLMAITRYSDRRMCLKYLDPLSLCKAHDSFLICDTVIYNSICCRVGQYYDITVN